MITGQNFVMRKGQTKYVNITLSDEETGAALPISTQNITWQVMDRRSSTTTRLSKTRTSGITVRNASAGQIRLSIDANESDSLPVGHYYHILWVKTASGVETPALEGRVEVLAAGPGV